MQVKYIAVKTTKEMVPNKYFSFSRGSVSLEPEYIEEYRNTVVHLYSEKELHNNIVDLHNDNVLREWTFYEVKEIKPTVNVIVDVKLS